MSKNLAEAAAMLADIDTGADDGASESNGATGAPANSAPKPGDATSPALLEAAGEKPSKRSAPADDSEETDDKPAKPEPTVAELRKAEMAERLKKLQASTAKRKADQSAAAKQREIDALQKAAKQAREEAAKEREEAAKERKAFNELFQRDPIAAFKMVGKRPEEVYDHMSTYAERANSPDGQLARMREELKAELAKEHEPTKTEIAEMRAQLAEFKRMHESAAADRFSWQKKTAEDDFLKETRKAGHEVLADQFDDEELVQLGNDLANEFIEAGQDFEIADIVRELKSRVEYRVKRQEERRNQRTASTSRGGATERAPAANAPSADTVTNSMASSVASSVPKKKTRDQLRQEAARDLLFLDK